MTRGARRGPRLLAAFGLLCVTTASYGVLLSHLWTQTEQKQQLTADERAGVAYLQPLVGLVGVLSQAGSVAVGGGAADTGAITAAIAAVDKAEAAYGERLETSHRWSDLSQGIERLNSAAPTGQAAADQYGDALALARALAAQVGDRSQLSLDPALDTHYLMSVVLDRLPAVLTSTGQVLDAATLDGTGVTGALAAYQLSQLAQGVSADVGRASDAGRRMFTGPGLLPALDEFRAAADLVAPPPALRLQPVKTAAGVLTKNVDRLHTAILKLADACFDNLDAALAERVRAQDDTRTTEIFLAAGATVVVLLLLWWTVPAPVERRAADVDDDGADDAVAMDLPSIDAHDLLLTEEIIHSGRSVTARRISHDQ